MSLVPGVSTDGVNQSGDRLDSWKEIAAYLRRGVSTVQRWEHEEGLPVRRHLHGKGGSVYAYRSEIDCWWENRRQDLNVREPSPSDAVPDTAENPRRPGRWIWTPGPAMVGMLVLVILVASNAFRSYQRPITSLAVLPLKNLTGNPADEWFVKGVTDALAVQVKADLTPNQRVRLTRSRSVRPEAYEAYLRAQYFRQRRQTGGCVSAERYLREAVALDAGFAEPHAVLAFCYGFDRLVGQLSASEAALRANREVTRALQLDSGLADAHVSLALIRHRLEFDWDAAERSFKRALELSPPQIDARAFYGELLWASGRTEEGLRMQRSALALQPFHIGNNVGVGYALYNLRRYDEAIDQLRKAVELDPTWHMARFWLAEAYAANGQHPQAVNEYSEWLRLVLIPARVSEDVAKCLEGYRNGGPEGFWRAELKLAEEEERHPGTLWRQPYDSSRARYLMARRYARLGYHDLALRSLVAAYEGRSYLIVTLNTEPLFDRLHTEPGFQDLVRRVGLKPKGPTS